MAERYEVVIVAKDEASGTLKGIGGGLMDIGKTALGVFAGGLITDAVQGIVGILPDMIGAGSDLSETFNKVNTVFGDASDQIVAFSEAAGTQLGQSQQAALDAAATFGVYAKAAGLGDGATADFSTTLVGLSSDLASFYNTSPEEAINAIGAALRGESEPLRKYGVLMDDASLRQVAFEKGLISTTKQALTPQQKTLAAYELIMRQTAVAQGDFEKTSGGLANQQRILAAQMDNMKATVGGALLPVMTQFMTILTDVASSPQFQAFLDNAVGALSNLAMWLGTNVPVAIEVLTSWYRENLEPILAGLGEQAGTILPGILATLSGIWTNTLLPALQSVWAFLQENLTPILQALADYIGTTLPPTLALLAGFWTNVLQPALLKVWAFIQGNVIPILAQVFRWLAQVIPPALATLSQWWTGTLLPAVQRVWEFLSQDMMPVWRALGTLLQATLGTALRVLTALWNNVLLPAMRNLWTFIQEKIFPMWDTFVSWLNKVTGGFDGIKAAIDTVSGWIGNLATAIGGLELPDWLTPGSPTPFETGLHGIARALAEVNSGAFKLQRGIGQVGVPTYANGGQVSNYWQLTINEAGRAVEPVLGFRLMQAMAG